MDNEKIPKRLRARRNGFTVPNPFLTENVKVVDINNLTDEQKAMPRMSHDYSFLKQEKYADLIDFFWVEYKKNKVKDDNSTAELVLGERPFFKNYECAKEFFKRVDFVEYFCFKYEKGEKTGLLHLQGFMRYNKPLDMKTVHKIYPTIHLDPSYGTNNECRDYCMKDATSIEGYDFYEFGNFVEEAQRTDMRKLAKDIKEGKSYDEMFDDYTWLMIQSGDKIMKAMQKHKQERFKNVVRQLHITYIYGKEGAGKTTYPERVLGYEPMQIGIVGEYNTTGMFDEYDGQDIIVFDEFDSQIDLTKMNKYLDGRPCSLHGRQYNRVACYTKVFIMSNYPLADLYKKARNEQGKEPSYKGFVRRINEIIYMPDFNTYEWQKGRPTDEVIATLETQGAKIKLLPQSAEQIKIGEVQK